MKKLGLATAAAVAISLGSGMALLSPAHAATTSGYVAVNPSRVMDTRSGLGGPTLQPGETRRLVLVPIEGATAVALNVTVTNPSSAGFVTVFPGGAVPASSSVNFVAGQTVPNLVMTGLSLNSVSIFNALGTTDVIADVQGWFTGESFHPITPQRALDTRDASPFVAGQTVSLPLGGSFVPAGAKAVAINLTATRPSAAGYLTVWPSGQAQPTASNVNFTRGQSVPNAAIVGLGGGSIDILNALATTDVLVDVTGYFSDDSYRPITPSRQVDTRNGQCGGTLHSGDQLVMGLGQAGGGSAVALNITATNTTADGFFTLYPAGAGRPTASNLNFTVGQTVANAALVQTGANGRVSLFNFGGDADVIVDVQGWFGAPIGTLGTCTLFAAPAPAPPPPPPPPPAPPAYQWQSGGAGFNVNTYADHPLYTIPGWTDANYRATNLTRTAKSWDVYINWTSGTQTHDYLTCTPAGGSQDSNITDYKTHGSRITSIEAFVAIDWHSPNC